MVCSRILTPRSTGTRVHRDARVPGGSAIAPEAYIGKPTIRGSSRLPLLYVAGFLAVVVVLAERVWRKQGFSWDGPIVDFLDWVAPVSSDEVHVDPIVDGVTFVVAGLTAAVVLAQLAMRRVRAALFLALGVAGSVALSSLAKVIVQRPAIEGDGYSFPSGSATWSMATAAALVLLASSARRSRLFALGAGGFVVAYAGVITWEQWHYPSDVLAGWSLALACVCGLWLILGCPRAPLLAAASGTRRRHVARLRS